uniref:Uncharacterized protein n=1 Tax=Alexandrium andersonii TaxID=327968 RepID=A0A7S2C144_9DINO
MSYDVNPASMSEVVDKVNPFEGSWGVLRALKAEVRELQAMLHAEQQKREDEVGKLRQELKQCREDLDREKKERIEEMQRLIDPINTEQEKCREEFRKAKAQRDQNFRELKQAVEDENKTRSKDVSQLLERIGAEEAQQASNAKSLQDSLADTQRQLERSSHDSRHCISCLMQDVKLISDQLVHVACTWQGYRSDQIQASNMPMRPSTNKPLTSRPMSPNIGGSIGGAPIGGGSDVPAPLGSRQPTKPGS